MNIESAYSKALGIVNGNVTDIDQICAALRYAAAEKREAEKMLARSPITSAIRTSEMADKAHRMLCKHFDKVTA